MNEINYIEEIRNLYYNSKLKDCIQLCNEFQTKYQQFTEYQIILLYKGRCLYELGQINDGYKCLKSLIQESEKRKNEKIEEIDLFIRGLYQLILFVDDDYMAEQKNQELYELCLKYQNQHPTKDIFQQPLYLVALGCFKFIDSYRDEDELECIKLLQKSLKLTDKYKQEIQFLIGWMYLQKEKNQEALKNYLQLHQQYPNYPSLNYNIAYAYLMIKQYQLSEEYFQKLSEIQPSNQNPIFCIAYLCELQKKYSQAREYYEQHLQKYPESEYAYYRYCKFLQGQNENDKVEQILNDVIQKFPQNCDFYELLSEISSNKQNFDQCLEYINKCIELKPNEGYYYSLAGDFLIELNKYNEALQFCKKAISLKLYPNFYKETLQSIAFCLYNLERYEESLEYLLMILDLNILIDQQSLVDDICSILEYINQKISTLKVKELFNKFSGALLSRLDYISNEIKNIELKQFLELKLINYSQLLQILAYQNVIQPNLTYQNEISHWDLFID